MQTEELEPLRAEMREGFQTVNAKLDGLQSVTARLDAGLQAANARLDGLETVTARLDAGLQAANARLDGLETVTARLDAGLQTLTAKVDGGFADMHRALHGLMFKLLTPSEINEIRSQMKSPPEMRTFPFWAIR